MEKYWSHCYAGWRGQSDFLWVGGLAVVQLHMVDRWLVLQGEAYEWTQYVLLGTLFPATLLVLALASSLGPRISAVAGLLQSLLAVAGVALVARALAPGLAAAVLVIAAVQCLTAGTLAAIRVRRVASSGLLIIRWSARRSLALARARIPAILGLPLVAAGSWALAVRFVWWTPFADWISRSVFTFVVFSASLVLVTLNVCGPGDGAGQRGRRTAAFALDLLALLVIAAASVQVDVFRDSIPLPPYPQDLVTDDRGWAVHINEGAHLHWGPLIGPAELVRQGGWLLWDVPSQYGFLNTLLVACLSSRSIWQSFYVVNAALMFLSAAILYALLRSTRTGPVGRVLALALTLSTVFLVPGRPDFGIGPLLTPAVGAYRFFWCYALLGVLVLAFRADCRGPMPRRMLVGGCLAWLLGVLWSAESAAYSVAIWVPAYALLAARRVQSLHKFESIRDWAHLAAWLCLPGLLLAATVGGISAYYALALGHLPDWRSYYEYCLGASIAALPIDRRGAVLTLLVAFWALSGVAAAHLRRRGGLAGLALISGAWATLWAPTSYFIGRSHETNATNLSPLLLAAIAAALHLLGRSGKAAAPLRAALVPVLTVLLTAGFGSPTLLSDDLATLRSGYVHNLDRRVMVMDESLAGLLRSAGVRRDDPIVLAASARLPARPHGPGGQSRQATYRTWLPTDPFVLLAPLPVERQKVYIARFAARARMGGWLIREKSRDQSYFAEVLGGLERTHVQAESFENARWQLTRYVRRDPAIPESDPARLGEAGPNADRLRR
jgi:hypothetical protein